jgi:hypothetical protein
MTAPDWTPIPLTFEVTEDDGGPPGEHAVTITSVNRDQHGIRVRYEIVPPLAASGVGPWGKAQDDLGNRYDDRGGAHGLDRERNVTDGVLTLVSPVRNAGRLLVRIAWDDLDDIWTSPAYELRIDLSDSPDEPERTG